jgi:hypothetical protein
MGVSRPALFAVLLTVDLRRWRAQREAQAEAVGHLAGDGSAGTYSRDRNDCISVGGKRK